MFAMRRVAIGVGLVLTAVAVALFVLFSQTEVARTFRQGSPVHVLFIRVDEGASGRTQADAMAVAIVQPGGKTTWLSVPQGLVWPNAPGGASILDLYASEGVVGLSRRLSLLLEVPLSYWVVVDSAAFRAIVDALGGVELSVESRLVYQDRARNLFIDIPAGSHLFDGRMALDYVRYQDGDELARVARQHALLRALIQKAASIPMAQWRPLVEMVHRTVETNLSLWETLDLVRALGDLAPERFTFSAVPSVARPGSPQARVPDLVRLRKVVQAAVGGRAYFTRDEVRVLVLNGTGQRLLATRTGAWLTDLGFEVTAISDADRSNYPRTYIVVREETRDKGRALYEVMAASVQPGVQIQTDREFDMTRVGGWPKDVDLILILGAGFDVRS
ncbi:MAG: hypothetical protein BIP78_0634 [Candidatus Bipolaricaulis sibiricus]|uniref:Cell envelope-related transcriptional attenuator domain-containing protein n=1 Tax=Bipolaricaulis sibiricus TaxID=2501609 RepID=A0A410FTZ8_BIPS1|nr:MAG: hypothetical protein BIP78_0634 [Candidatus Bipolaricaulis sibiricus]